MAQVQIEGKRTVSRQIPYFNLDMIISVGYRVNAKRGVQFRRWANKVLKEYLVKGYAVNDRLRRDQLGELRQLVQVVGRTLQCQDVTATTDGQALFDVVVDYTYALDTLVALTLMIAESRTEEKDVMVKVVVNLINQRNE
ncbi:MAG: hypothetical protein E7099_00445 [Mediterranea massiliensis]|nr:hypothetical protein [Mediterranea massiliensis]